MDDTVLPRYGERSLAEVLPAALRALGVPDGDPAPGALRFDPVRAVAVLLVDGLGSGLLREHAADAPFLAAMADSGPLTVGFPSSTSISLASLGTGLPPGAHGVLGITFRLGDGLIDSLRWTSHDGEDRDLRDEHPPEQVQPEPTALQRAAAAGVGVTTVSQRAFRGSGLTRAALRGGRFRGTFALGDLAAEVLTALGEPGRRLCYGYHADLDGIGHAYGPGSAAWRHQLGTVDRAVERIAAGLPSDALLVVTGDHGMVTATRRYDADTDVDLQRGVALLGGDPRARHAYARPGATADVLATWRAVLRDDAWVLTGEEAVERGWFGPRVPDAHRARIGDVVVAARGDAAIVRSEAEPHISTMPGQHGSLTAAEQLVPLLTVSG